MGYIRHGPEKGKPVARRGRKAHGPLPGGGAAGPSKEESLLSKTRAAAVKGGRYARLADEELISLVGAGDARAFAALYDRHSRAAYVMAYR
ncbi:MAG: RNA polymerase ECF-type sigma factor [uncultured Rubrobacteraceae bacterium]|uniref:RNA polymerase ECF-type sigma factor n=1 Tax=uncultured Rubrobacteraceae bacterium TaxID=349277 RepID=A0A6J4NTE6_9ACTN|nr:MAG: RNA polymerase ECF-type sigma factor [uncultured Rubrobacteraceae bacterium]